MKYQFDEILHIDDPEFAQKFARAIGVSPGDAVEIATPQFNRTGGIIPSIPDGIWHQLHTLSMSTLKSIGCSQWDEEDEHGRVLMLFPAEWYPYIPAGLPITDINGNDELFEPGITDDDRRAGVLAYGVVIKGGS
jgi:hypothetical protein